MIRELTDSIVECITHKVRMKEKQLTLSEERSIRDCDFVIDNTRKHWTCASCHIVWVSVLEQDNINILAVPKSQ